MWKIAGRAALAALMAVTTLTAVASAPDQLFVAQAEAAWTLNQLHVPAAPEVDQRHVAKHVNTTFGPVDFNGPFKTLETCQYYLNDLRNNHPDWCFGTCHHYAANVVSPGYPAGYYFHFRRSLD